MFTGYPIQRHRNRLKKSKSPNRRFRCQLISRGWQPEIQLCGWTAFWLPCDSPNSEELLFEELLIAYLVDVGRLIFFDCGVKIEINLEWLNRNFIHNWVLWGDIILIYRNSHPPTFFFAPSQRRQNILARLIFYPFLHLTCEHAQDHPKRKFTIGRNPFAAKKNI